MMMVFRSGLPNLKPVKHVLLVIHTTRENIFLDIRKGKKELLITSYLDLDKDLFNESLTMVIDKANIKTAIVKQEDKEMSVKILPDKIMFDFNPFGGTIKIQLKPIDN